MSKEFFIVCTRHKFAPNIGFWKPNRCGYTTRLEEAGRYSEEEAMRIQNACESEDFAVPCNVAEAAGRTSTQVDGDALDSWRRSYAADGGAE